jgi:hypothetical protein
MNRAQYIEDSLKATRERHAIELERARHFFGDEWDKEHSDD